MASDSEVPADTARPVRWGLSLRLFAILTLLGAIAVLVTGTLGYVRAHDALEQAIYNQLTTARQIKARQVETYFRTIHAELRLLATSKMVVEASREFRVAFNELDREPLTDDIRQKVSDWYGVHFVPEISRVLGTAPVLADYLPVGSGANYLQSHYIVIHTQKMVSYVRTDEACAACYQRSNHWIPIISS